MSKFYTHISTQREFKECAWLFNNKKMYVFPFGLMFFIIVILISFKHYYSIIYVAKYKKSSLTYILKEVKWVKKEVQEKLPN
jgi:hypothetical protein